MPDTPVRTPKVRSEKAQAKRAARIAERKARRRAGHEFTSPPEGINDSPSAAPLVTLKAAPSEKALAKRAARIAERKARRRALRQAAPHSREGTGTTQVAPPFILKVGPAVASQQPAIDDEAHGSKLPPCRKLAAAGDWQAVVEMTNDEQAALRQPKLLFYRLEAAKALGNAALFEDVARVTAMLPNEVASKTALLHDLVKAGHGMLTLQILRADPSLCADPRISKMIRRIVLSRIDRRLREEFRDTARMALGGSLLEEIQPSSFVFAPRTNTSPVLGSVRLAASPGVPDHHLPGLKREADRCRRGLEKALANDWKPVLLEVHNVFTDRHGQIWREDGAIIRSTADPIPQMTREAVPQVPMAFLLHNKTKGIYHWLVDRVPRLAWLAEPANDAGALPILMSDNAPRFEMDCMEMLGLADRVQRVSDALFVERLILPKVTFRRMVGWSHVDWGIRKLIEVSMAKAAEAGIDLPQRVYISRRDAERRRLLNEEAVEEAAIERGFALYQFSTLPIWHQIALMHSARIVMGPHGAGLAHLIMAKPGTKVLEIIPIKDGTYQLRFNYARLSIVKGLDYRGWIEVQEDSADSWTLDLEPFLGFLDTTLAEPEPGT